MPRAREVRPTRSELARLPYERVDRWTQPFARFLRIEALGGGVLLLSAAAALALANSPWANQYMGVWELPLGLKAGPVELTRSLRSWINDGGMTLFFFLVALELKRELVLGALRDAQSAALSIAGALGGMLVPAALYLALQWGQPGQGGWGTVMATDTAFVIGCLALLGSRIPLSLRIFMLSLAIVDDIGAILIVAIGYSSGITWWLLVAAGAGIAIIRAMTIMGLRGFPIYVLVGALVWIAVDASGIHATITGVALGLLTPARRWVSDERLRAILGQVIVHPTSEERSGHTPDRHTLRLAEKAAREALSPAERLEMALHPWVGFVIMPMFALANAGMPFRVDSWSDSVTIAVVIGFVIGKPVGILLFAWLAIRCGLAALPADLDWRLLAGGGLLAGIGFTMALFIANLAFESTSLDSAKLGILVASITSALAGVGLLTAATRFSANVDSTRGT